MFEDFAELSPVVWTALISLVLIAFVVFVISRSRRRFSATMLSVAAACLALAFVLSCVRLYRMPQGGSVTPASMLPIMIFACVFGTIPGLLVGLAYGLMQMLQDPTLLHPVQILVDYILPFLSLALCGLFRDVKVVPPYFRLHVGIIVASLTRLCFHVLSGAVFFAEYAGDVNPWVYSIGYNCPAMGIDGLICLVVASLPPVQKLIETMRVRYSDAKTKITAASI